MAEISPIRDPATLRPLIGAERLAASGPVLVVDSAKSAEAARQLFQSYVVVAPDGGDVVDFDWGGMRDRVVTVWAARDDRGEAFALRVARCAFYAGCMNVGRPDLPASVPAGWTLADPLPPGLTADDLWRALHHPQGVLVEAEVERLAGLDTIAYEHERTISAKRLHLSVLDEAVAVARAKRTAAFSTESSEDEPWPHPVDGAALLDDVVSTLRRFIVMEEPKLVGTALWVIACHAFDTFLAFPRLCVTGLRESGKTVLLSVIKPLVPRSQETVNITTAALYHVVDRRQPTLLLDEYDTFGLRDRELRGILNSGHSRGAYVLRLWGSGKNREARSFKTFCPAAIALIGRLPDTLESRSIVIKMKRRRPDQPIERFRPDRIADLSELHRRAARFAADHRAALSDADPSLPQLVANRGADNWIPLLAVADAAGGAWPQVARQAAETLTIAPASLPLPLERPAMVGNAGAMSACSSAAGASSKRSLSLARAYWSQNLGAILGCSKISDAAPDRSWH